MLMPYKNALFPTWIQQKGKHFIKANVHYEHYTANFRNNFIQGICTTPFIKCKFGK